MGHPPGSDTGARPAGSRLDSWKAIAVYLGREITTVQRWERLEQLPVHRHLHSKAGSVYAYTDELEVWRRQRTRDPASASRVNSAAEAEAAQGVALSAGARDRASAEARPGQTVPPATEGETATASPEADASRPSVSGGARAGADRTDPDSLPGDRTHGRGLRRRAWTALVLLAILAAVAVAVAWYPRARPSSSATEITRVAVLPLRNLSGDPGEDYFADSMTDAIIARLASSGVLQVSSHTSVTKFKDAKQTVPQIAGTLGVDAVVEGSVAQQGDRVRIIAKLIDGRTDAHVWTREFERPFQDVLALQREVAEAVATSIRVAVRSHRPSPDRVVVADAYQRYLKGRFLLNENTKPSLQQAIREFDASLMADPTFAPAYAGLASAHTDLSNTVIGAAVGRESNDRAIAAALRALELDPELAEAHSALGRALMLELRWKESEQSLRRGVELNPSDARTRLWLAEWLSVFGRNEEAVGEAQVAQQLDPLSLRTSAAVGFILGLNGRRDEAAAAYRSVLAVRPDHLQATFFLGSALAADGNAAEAIRHLEHAVELSEGSPHVLAALAVAYARAGRAADAKRQLDELLAREKSGWAPPSALAVAHAAVGNHDAAFAALERAVEQHTRGVHLLKVASTYRPMHDDPRFAALLKRTGVE